MTLPAPLPPVLTTGQVAELLGYLRERGANAGKPNRQIIRELVRTGKMPPPIDDTLDPTRWRWNLEVVQSYIAGTWTAPKSKARAS